MPDESEDEDDEDRDIDMSKLPVVVRSLWSMSIF